MKDKKRLSLMLVLAALVFCVLFVSLLVAVGAVYLLTFFGVIAQYEGTTMEALPLLLFMALISLVVGAIFAVLAGHLPMKPINNFIDAMNRLASGDYKARLQFGKALNSHPVTKEVTDSFNTMAQELENTQLLRSDFVNNFSHEFKTPIVSIAGFAKLLRRGNLPEQQKEEYLAIIEEESLRLASMATNVLELSKVENQTILTDVTKFNLSEQLRHSALLLEGKWSRKGIDLDLEFDEYEVSGNEELLKQVWINLLDNAIKFSPEKGEILVRIARDGAGIQVLITNYGEDIDPDKQGRVWSKFYQADESHATQGNGVGLAIVKAVVDLHKGKAALHSENGVTTFSVWLPNE